MKVLNDIYNAKPDGLTWGGGIGWGWGIYGPKMVELLPEAKYEIEKYVWIGGLQREGIVWVVPPDSEVESLADLLDKEDLVFAAGAPAFGGSLAGAAFIDWFGIDATITPGVDIPDKRLGLQRGEFDFSCETSGNCLLWEQEGQAKRIAVVSDKSEAFAAGIPPMTEQVNLTEEQVAVLSTIVAASTSMRVWFAPPGIPEDRVEWMRESWRKVADNEAFQAMWQRRWPDWQEPFYGEEMQEWVEERMAQPPDLLQEILAIEEKYIR
jgi:tripartite-type tricarboxylate transporter receptor subunit TctC